MSAAQIQQLAQMAIKEIQTPGARTRKPHGSARAVIVRAISVAVALDRLERAESKGGEGHE